MLYFTSACICFGEETRASVVDLQIYIGSIPTEHQEWFHDMLTASFQRIAKDGVNMKRVAQSRRNVGTWGLFLSIVMMSSFSPIIIPLVAQQT
jgi:uncharacterized membrane protein